jgi:hypothetical protein
MKRVRFSPTTSTCLLDKGVEIVENNAIFVSSSPANALWYSSEELKFMHLAAAETCRKVRNKTDSLKFRKLNDLLDQCDLMLETNLSLTFPSTKDTVRGLEGLISPSLGQYRQIKRYRTVKRVLLAQTVARQLGKKVTNCNSVPEFVALVAQGESVGAVRLALLLGEVDQKAATQA